jgi:PAS domain S-box-containing protein
LNKWDTEKENVYKALKRSEDEIIYNASLLLNISDAIVSTDNDFRVVSWNKGAEEMYVWSAGEAIGREFRTIVKPIYEKHDADELRQAYLERREHLGCWACTNGLLISVGNTKLLGHQVAEQSFR